MKNLLLFSTILFTSASAFAQLTVRPNGPADSYVYVKDQILFVTGDIALSRNGIANDQEASIYLRDNGQLIQGGTTSTNSGDGQLSVQQNSPDTNAFAYYYWCSPIGNTRTPANVATPPGNRNFGVGHLYEPVPSLGVTAALLSGTTTGRDGTINPMTISTRWLYTHKFPGDEAEANYQRMNGGNNAPAGYGFTMKGLGTVPDYDQNYEFRGRPNNGDFEIPVAGPVTGPVGTVAQMTLTGNPYPSALDLNKLFYEPGNEALGSIYYYDEDRTAMTHNYSGKPFGYGTWIPLLPDNTPDDHSDFEGAYSAATFYIWNAAGNHGGPGTNGTTVIDKRYAPIGQGFMFVGDNSGDVTIKNSHRVFVKEGASTNSVFQRPEGNDETITENNLGPTLSTLPTSADSRTPQTRIYAIFNDALTRDMLLVFSDQATDGYDRGMDGLSPMGMTTDAYFPVGNDNDRLPYVINSVNFDVNKQIPIAFKLNKQTTIKLRIQEEVKKPYQHIFLFDSQENTYKKLTPAAAVAPTLTLPAGTYNNRFFIVFRSPFIKRDVPSTELERTVVVQKNVTFFQNNPQHQLEVSNPDGYTLKSASVYDMSGKLVISESNLGDSNKYSFYTGNLSDGVYLVKLMTTDDIAIDYKAIVHN